MRFVKLLLNIFIVAAFFFIAYYFLKSFQENKILKEVIERLSADSRVAEVLVTKVTGAPDTGKTFTTVKFLEYDAKQKPLAPKYFTFVGNIIQFQSLVIRFDDFYVRRSHPLKGKSAYIFMKVFALGDKGAEVFQINEINEIPSGYEVEGARSGFERKLWKEFWNYALRPGRAKKLGIKNAQIEAPGTKFIPGVLYTLRIEHDGGLRIDTEKLPEILKGEKIDF